MSSLSRPDTTGYPGTERLAGAGQVTRPGRRRVLLGRLPPDRGVASRPLARAGVRDLAAVLVAHAHYDHALDAPRVGSESTANMAAAGDCPNPGSRSSQTAHTSDSAPSW